MRWEDGVCERGWLVCRMYGPVRLSSIVKSERQDVRDGRSDNTV